ncbi:MAG: hypothetical protein AAF628_25640 [Planctomycetota bacterium]
MDPAPSRPPHTFEFTFDEAFVHRGLRRSLGKATLRGVIGLTAIGAGLCLITDYDAGSILRGIGIAIPVVVVLLAFKKAPRRQGDLRPVEDPVTRADPALRDR